MTTPPISVIVLTHNEEDNIVDCLSSAAGFDDVHVLDSGSTDRTVELARRYGAQVHHNPFRSFGQQRNWAIDHIKVAHAWQFHLDADERLTSELTDEMSRELAGAPSVGGYFIPSKLIFGDCWLRHAGDYPTYQVRLIHRDRMRFTDCGHGQREDTRYPIGRLREPYLHLAFNKGLDHWFIKHIQYAKREAEEAVNTRSKASLLELFATSDPIARRRALKSLSYKVPGRYVFRLMYMLFFKRAFLDGPAGVTYAHMLATYESMIEIYLNVVRNKITL